MHSATSTRLSHIFENIHSNVNAILNENSDVEFATDLITRSISADLNMRLNALLSDIYTALSEETLRLKIFGNSKNQNIFFEANIEQSIFEKYRFDVDSVETFKKGIQTSQLNQLYVSASAAAGTATLGGLLTYALSGTIVIPLVVAIAGAVAAFCATYFKVVPNMNRQRFRAGLDQFLEALRSEIEHWVSAVEAYYQARVQETISTLEK